MYVTNKPAVARFKNVFVSEANAASIRQLSTGACSVVAVMVTGGSSSALVRVVDSANAAAGYSVEDGFSVACESSNSQDFCPSEEYPMKKGLALVFEQGEGSNAEVTILYN